MSSLLLATLAFEIVAAPPPDAALLDVVKAAQKANLAKLTKGEVIAVLTHHFEGDSTPRGKSTCRTVWRDDKAYFEASLVDYTKHMKIHGTMVKGAAPEKLRSVIRAVLDGKNCYIYYANRGVYGEATIAPAKQFAATIHSPTIVDQRPATQWYHPFGLPTSMEQYIDEIDLTNNPDAAWKADIVQEGSRVIVSAKDAATKKEIGRLEFDLALGGLLVLEKGASKASPTGTCEWEQRGDVAVLKRMEFRRKDEGRVELRTLEIKKFEAQPFIAANLFTIESLRIRPGARVDDRASGRIYTYGGRSVKQEDLDKLIDAGKKRRTGGTKP